MIVCQDFIKLIGKEISRILIVVWPPIGEANMLDVDMSIALAVGQHEGGAFHIRIDKDDCWTPIISETDFGEVFEWRDFQQRIDGWMGGHMDIPLQLEVFDATNNGVFGNIVSKEILDIECITLKSEFNPFAVKIIFPDDYILVSPISDGTTIETSEFNKLENLRVYEEIDELEFVPIRSAMHRAGN